MSQRVSSDHPTVTTCRATIERVGATHRPRLRLSAADAAHFPESGVVRFMIDEQSYHALIENEASSPIISGAFENPRIARLGGAGTNRLTEWILARELEFGRTVLIDVVVPDFQYGLRLPGNEVVYQVSEPPTASLRDIADRLDGGTD